MNIEVMKQALEALESKYIVNCGAWRLQQDEAITALRQAIEFEEMVKKGTKAWADTPDDWVDELRGGTEKREWVGLTDKERFLNDARSEEEIEYAKAIEAKLKEKNGG